MNCNNCAAYPDFLLFPLRLLALELILFVCNRFLHPRPTPCAAKDKFFKACSTLAEYSRTAFCSTTLWILFQAAFSFSSRSINLSSSPFWCSSVLFVSVAARRWPRPLLLFYFSLWRHDAASLYRVAWIWYVYKSLQYVLNLFKSMTIPTNPTHQPL